MQIISYQKIQFLSILDKYFKCYGNINAFWPLFGIGSYQLWPCHVTQAKNLSFPYLKSYCPLNFRKVTKFRGSAASLMEVIKMTIWRRVESAPTPLPPMWNRVKYSIECYAFWSWPRLTSLPDVSQFPDYFAFSRFENEATAQCFAEPKHLTIIIFMIKNYLSKI